MLHTTWFILIFVLLTGYAILDGFDLGVGILHLFSKKEREKKIMVKSIGPIWDGNEVWLITVVGAMFAAFPPIYANILSGLYIPMILFLGGIIFRAISLEFQHYVESPFLKSFFTKAFGVSSLVITVLFGLILGNLLRGLPIDATMNYVGGANFFHPYNFLVALLVTILFVMHGANWLVLKTEGELMNRMVNWSSRMWMLFILLYGVAVVVTLYSAPHIMQGLSERPIFWPLQLLMIFPFFFMPNFLYQGKALKAFVMSGLLIFCLFFSVAVGLYPVLLPSSFDTAFSLSAFNASSSESTLMNMLIIVLIGMPLVLTYTGFIYWSFRGKVKLEDGEYH